MDSLIAVIAAVAIGLTQLVISANKKKKERLRMVQQRMGQPMNEPDPEPESVWHAPAPGPVFFEEEAGLSERVKMEEALAAPAELFPMEEASPIGKPISSESIDDKEEEEYLLEDFSPLKAVLYSEILNPKWNS